ncbi:MAG: hypothetical protein H6863_01380 [Rhodospirillales bacterium]|nr:hypothetical protein [Rhodospirillales bacterium]
MGLKSFMIGVAFGVAAHSGWDLAKYEPLAARGTLLSCYNGVATKKPAETDYPGKPFVGRMLDCARSPGIEMWYTLEK